MSEKKIHDTVAKTTELAPPLALQLEDLTHRVQSLELQYLLLAKRMRDSGQFIDLSK